MTDMIEVKVDDLIGVALDWAIASVQADVYPVVMAGAVYHDTDWDHIRYSPSVDWKYGGPLIQKYDVLLSPPKSMVHRNYGNFDKRNGWYESGVWGATIFGKERKHRRRSFEHPDQPLVAAMRAIVQFELGDVVSVPAALVEGGAQ